MRKKYVVSEDAFISHHLLAELMPKHKLTIDWRGRQNFFQLNLREERMITEYFRDLELHIFERKMAGDWQHISSDRKLPETHYKIEFQFHVPIQGITAV